MWFSCICRVWLSEESTVLLRGFWHSLLNNVGFEVMLDGFFQLLCVHFISPSHLWRDSYVWMAHGHYYRLSCFNIYRIWLLSKRINLSDGDHDEISSWKKCTVLIFIPPWSSICQQLGDLGSSPALSPGGHRGFWIILGICCHQEQLRSWSHKSGRSHGALWIKQIRNHIINAHHCSKVWIQ